MSVMERTLYIIRGKAEQLHTTLTIHVFSMRFCRAGTNEKMKLLHDLDPFKAGNSYIVIPYWLPEGQWGGLLCDSENRNVCMCNPAQSVAGNDLLKSVANTIILPFALAFHKKRWTVSNANQIPTCDTENSGLWTLVFFEMCVNGLWSEDIPVSRSDEVSVEDYLRYRYLCFNVFDDDEDE